MFHIASTVVANEAVSEDVYRMVLLAPTIAASVRPGQFVNIRVREDNDPLCRRPFTVARCPSLEAGTRGIEVVYKVVGRGTRVLAAMCQGEQLDVIGPLGHGFEWDRSKKAQVLVGGGMGAAAVYTLAEEIATASRQEGQRLHVVLGARTRDAVIMEREFIALGSALEVATDDGSYGRRGTTVEALRSLIERKVIAADDCAVYASGPEAMTRALASLCREYGIPGQATMEKHMLCGLGGCLTCVCKVNGEAVLKHRELPGSHIQLDPTGQWGYALVCKDGPVFNLDEVVFDD